MNRCQRVDVRFTLLWLWRGIHSVLFYSVACLPAEAINILNCWIFCLVAAVTVILTSLFSVQNNKSYALSVSLIDLIRQWNRSLLPFAVSVPINHQLSLNLPVDSRCTDHCCRCVTSKRKVMAFNRVRIWLYWTQNISVQRGDGAKCGGDKEQKQLWENS